MRPERSSSGQSSSAVCGSASVHRADGIEYANSSRTTFVHGINPVTSDRCIWVSPLAVVRLLFPYVAECARSNAERSIANPFRHAEHDLRVTARRRLAVTCRPVDAVIRARQRAVAYRAALQFHPA